MVDAKVDLSDNNQSKSLQTTFVTSSDLLKGNPG